MNDLISKEVVIDTLKAVRDLVWDVDIPSPTVPEYIEHHEQMQSIMRNIDILTDKIIKMPSVQPESAEMLSGKVWDEWCTGCKEYDHEKHCCPRFNRVIRTAIDDAQPEIVRCKDCKHYKTEFCAIDLWTDKVKIYKARPDDFCSRAERRQDEQTN